MSALPVAVKPSLPSDFGGKMDGTTVSSFVHQQDTYFDLVDLKDDSQREDTLLSLCSKGLRVPGIASRVM